MRWFRLDIPTASEPDPTLAGTGSTHRVRERLPAAGDRGRLRPVEADRVPRGCLQFGGPWQRQRLNCRACAWESPPARRCPWKLRANSPSGWPAIAQLLWLERNRGHFLRSYRQVRTFRRRGSGAARRAAEGAGGSKAPCRQCRGADLRQSQAGRKAWRVDNAGPRGP